MNAFCCGWFDLLALVPLAALLWALVAVRRRDVLPLWLASLVAFLCSASASAGLRFLRGVPYHVGLAGSARLIWIVECTVLLGACVLLLAASKRAEPAARWLMSVAAGLALLWPGRMAIEAVGSSTSAVGWRLQGYVLAWYAALLPSVAGMALVAIPVSRRVRPGAGATATLACAFLLGGAAWGLAELLVFGPGYRMSVPMGAAAAAVVLAMGLLGPGAGARSTFHCRSPGCGAENDPGASFCRRCGRTIGS